MTNALFRRLPLRLPVSVPSIRKERPVIERARLVCLAVVCAVALPACATIYPPAYSAEPIDARVIDAETKQPLEGVVVTADWELRGGASPGGSTTVGELMVMEAVTDKNGQFHFPAWGPIRQFKGELHNHDPRLILFKSGYEYRILSNEPRFDAEAALQPVRHSQWNGKTIELQKFVGTPEQWFGMLERVIPPYERPEDARQSLMLKAILAEENVVPDSIPEKRPFFDNIVRRLLAGR